jgi:hypothetical protein
MIELYTGRGVGEGDAATAITSLSRYPSFFVDLMMTQELGMVPVSARLQGEAGCGGTKGGGGERKVGRGLHGVEGWQGW